MTAETIFTPGPWQTEYNDKEGSLTVWAGSAIEERHSGVYDSVGEMKIYDCIYDNEEEFSEFEANANLIAAAPDLYAASAAAVDRLADLPRFLRQNCGQVLAGIVEEVLDTHRVALAKARGEA